MCVRMADIKEGQIGKSYSTFAEGLPKLKLLQSPILFRVPQKGSNAHDNRESHLLQFSNNTTK